MKTLVAISAWKPSPGNFALGTDTRELARETSSLENLADNFHLGVSPLGSSTWGLSLGSFRLGPKAGDPIDGSWGDQDGDWDSGFGQLGKSATNRNPKIQAISSWAEMATSRNPTIQTMGSWVGTATNPSVGI